MAVAALLAWLKAEECGSSPEKGRKPGPALVAQTAHLVAWQRVLALLPAQETAKAGLLGVQTGDLRRSQGAVAQ
jgi:hypothetical protein